MSCAAWHDRALTHTCVICLLGCVTNTSEEDFVALLSKKNQLVSILVAEYVM